MKLPKIVITSETDSKTNNRFLKFLAGTTFLSMLLMTIMMENLDSQLDQLIEETKDLSERMDKLDEAVDFYQKETDKEKNLRDTFLQKADSMEQELLTIEEKIKPDTIIRETPVSGPGPEDIEFTGEMEILGNPSLKDNHLDLF